MPLRHTHVTGSAKSTLAHRTTTRCRNNCKLLVYSFLYSLARSLIRSLSHMHTKSYRSFATETNTFVLRTDKHSPFIWKMRIMKIHVQIASEIHFLLMMRRRRRQRRRWLLVPLCRCWPHQYIHVAAGTIYHLMKCLCVF